MKTSNERISTCNNCRFFNPAGHLHGSCERLHVTVDGDWPACRLGAPAFLASDEPLDRRSRTSGNLATASVS